MKDNYRKRTGRDDNTTDAPGRGSFGGKRKGVVAGGSARRKRSLTRRSEAGSGDKKTVDPKEKTTASIPHKKNLLGGEETRAHVGAVQGKN